MYILRCLGPQTYSEKINKMELERYQGKKFKARVEEEQGAFGGVVEVSPEGTPLLPGQKIDFIFADKKGENFIYDSRLKNQRTYDFKVTYVDLQQRILFVRLIQPAIFTIKEGIDGLATRLKGIKNVETIETASAELLERIASYVPADERERGILEKYLGELARTQETARQNYLANQQRNEKLALWKNSMTIEKATADQMPQLRGMVEIFMKKTNRECFRFEDHLREFDARGDKTLVGLLGGEIVATATYNKRDAVEDKGDYPKDANLLEFMGISEFDPEFGRTFLKNVLPYVPLKGLYVGLWQHANLEFFKAIGFEETQSTNVHKKGHRGRADIIRHYIFNPKEE